MLRTLKAALKPTLQGKFLLLGKCALRVAASLKNGTRAAISPLHCRCMPETGACGKTLVVPHSDWP